MKVLVQYQWKCVRMGEARPSVRVRQYERAGEHEKKSEEKQNKHSKKTNASREQEILKEVQQNV